MVDAEVERCGEVDVLRAVFLETHPVLFTLEEQQDGTSPRFEVAFEGREVVQDVVGGFVIGAHQSHHVVAAPRGGEKRFCLS